MLNGRLLVSISCLLVFCISLSSCDNLRKKFVRQKKAGQETTDFIPVLEPQEYPAPEHNPVFNYENHYALIKAWYKDLWTAMDDKNDGMAKQSLKQISDHIEQMKLLLKAQKTQDLSRLASLLDSYRSSLDQPRSMRNISRVQSDLRAFDRMLRGQLRSDKLKGQFINQ